MRFSSKSKNDIKKLIAVNPEKKRFEFPIPFANELKVGKKDGEIKIKEDEKHGTYLVWRNKKYPVEILSKNQNKYEILLNGVSYSFSIETPTSFKRMKYLSSKSGSKKNQNLEAPMPGKIIEILTEEGREVRAGEPLLILEAMKMQNEIQSPVAGKIKKIHVSGGDNVMKDDLLIEIQNEK